MRQTGLFDSPSPVLLDDERGQLRYVPAVVDADSAQALFEGLRDRVPWQRQRRRMYDRELEVPRLVASYSLRAGVLPAELLLAAQAVRRVEPAPFDSVGLNLYRDRHDSVAPHNDHLDEIAKGQPIALLSLGAVRTFIFRAKREPRLQLELELEAGSVLVMSHATQLHFDHSIPKSRHPVGPRISLAFRVRPGGYRRREGLPSEPVATARRTR